MKRKVKRPFDNEQFRKGYVAGIFAAEKELNTELLHFAEKAHKIMSEGTFPDYGVKINFKDSNNTIATNLDMKTEEKAKKYDEALEWMREVYPTLTGAAKEDAEHYFPELKESDDKRIIEQIKFAVMQMSSDREDTKKECLAWLEKQKKQKPTVSRKEILYQLFQNGSIALSDYLYLTEEQKPAEWSEEDIDIINVLEYIVGKHRPNEIFKIGNKQGVSAYKICSWLKSLKNRGNFPKSNTNSPNEWSEEDKKMLLSIIKAFRIGALSTIGQEQWLKLLPERFNLQPSLEHLQKEKVYDIMAKLTNLSYSNLIPFNSEEYKKINEITSDVFDLLKYPIEKRQEQKPVEWSEEDKQNYKVICSIIHGTYVIETQEMQDKLLSWLKSLKPQSKQEQKESSDKSEISDGYHTFNELYYYRLLYNAAFFNLLPKEWVHKSKRHHDGKECFGGGWFIVMANLPTGQIANHYEIKDWDLFHIPEKETADKWDGHTPQEAAERLHKFLLEMPEQKPEAKLTGWVARDKEFDSYYGTGLILYSKKPRRSDNCWNGDIVIQLPWQIFPDLKWVDSPMEVEIIIRKK